MERLTQLQNSDWDSSAFDGVVTWLLGHLLIFLGVIISQFMKQVWLYRIRLSWTFGKMSKTVIIFSQLKYIRLIWHSIWPILVLEDDNNRYNNYRWRRTDLDEPKYMNALSSNIVLTQLLMFPRSNAEWVTLNFERWINSTVGDLIAKFQEALRLDNWCDSEVMIGRSDVTLLQSTYCRVELWSLKSMLGIKCW